MKYYFIYFKGGERHGFKHEAGLVGTDWYCQSLAEAEQWGGFSLSHPWYGYYEIIEVDDSEVLGGGR